MASKANFNSSPPCIASTGKACTCPPCLVFLDQMNPEIREYLTRNTSLASTRRHFRENFDQVLDSRLSPSEQASRLAAKALHENFGTRMNENGDMRSRGGMSRAAGGQTTNSQTITTNPDQFHDFLSPFFPEATPLSQLSVSEVQAVSGLVELNEARRDQLDRLEACTNRGLLPTPESESQPEHNIEYIRALGRRQNKKGQKGKFVETYKS